jgi:GntR family phosphonate transport system transcriptional regulator
MTTIATPEDTQLLKQRKNMPVLVVESVDVDPDGLAISYHVVRFAGERVQLTLEP